MKEFFTSSWASGLLVGFIMLIGFLFHAGQQSQEHDDRINFNAQQIADLKTQHKEDVKVLQDDVSDFKIDMQRELKELEIAGVGRDTLLIDLQVQVAQMQITLEHIDMQLNKLVEKSGVGNN